MIFTPTKLSGAYVIDPERIEDARGFFTRTFCQREFQAHGLSTVVAQASLSYNRRRGTLRGMHYQRAPYAEVKLVRCTAGAIHDIIIDLRPGSQTLAQHVAVELTAANGRMLYVPEGFAHGFLTLADNTEVAYQMSEFYEPSAGAGVRWNDPAFAISWPEAVQVIAERDAGYPDYCVPAR